MLRKIKSFFKPSNKQRADLLICCLSGLEALKTYPLNELYRLIVDGRQHAAGRGWGNYEKTEPGSVIGGFRGLSFAVTDLENTTLTLEFIRNLHAEMMKDVVADTEGPQPTPGQTKADVAAANDTQIDPATFFVLCERKPASKSSAMVNCTQDGLQELRNFIEPLKGRVWLDDYRDKFYIEYIGRCYVPRDVDNKILSSLIDQFNKDILLSENKEIKLRTIIKFISEVERLHPFSDGNIRTFVIGLLNRLLLQNGFYPATFRDPNIFDAYTLDELVKETKLAIDLTSQIISKLKEEKEEKESSEIFNYRTPEDDLDKNPSYKQAVENFAEVISSECCRLEKIAHSMSIGERSLGR